MINKIIHQVWIGPLEAPTKWLNSWKHHNPNWQYKLWGNNAVFGRKWHNQHLIDEYIRRYNEEVKNQENGKDVFRSSKGSVFRGEKATLFAWHVIADLLRYEILYEEGGYMPGADSLCLRSIDDKFTDDIELYTLRTGNLHSKRFDAYVLKYGDNKPEGQEGILYDRYRPENASPILAAKKGDPFLKNIIDELHKLKPEDLGEAVDTTGNVFMGKMIRKYKPKNLTMLDYTPRASRIRDNAHSVHYGGTTYNRYDIGRKKPNPIKVNIKESFIRKSK